MSNYDHDNKYRKLTIIENQGSFSATEQMRTLHQIIASKKKRKLCLKVSNEFRNGILRRSKY